MSVIIRLQGLPWSASAGDIRTFFHGLNIPDGGVHIVGGERGDAFIAFTSDEDARLAMQCNNAYLKDSPVQLFLSSKTEMQNVIAEARDGHAPRPAVIQPAHSNTSPVISRPPIDDYSRPDAGGRRVPNIPPYGDMGPLDDAHQPPDPRGMRGGIRHPPDTSSVTIGRLDGQYQAPESLQWVGRDNRNAPDVYSADPRGRDMERSDLPSRFPHDNSFSPQGFPSSRPPLSRDEPVDTSFTRETSDPSRTQLGSDLRNSQRPPSDVSSSSRSNRDESRRGSERRSIGDRGHRDENRNVRDEYRRPSDRSSADLSESRSSRDRSRRSEDNPDHSRSRSSKEGRYGSDSSRDTRQDTDRDRRDRDGRDSRRDSRKDNPDVRRSSSRHDDTNRRDLHGRDMERSDQSRPDSRREIERSETGRSDMTRPDTRRLDSSRPDMGRPDIGRPDLARSDSGRPDIGRGDLGRPDIGRPDIGSGDLDRPDIGRVDMSRPDLGRLDISRGDLGRLDRGRPDLGRPDLNRSDLGRPDLGRPDMNRSDMNRRDLGRGDLVRSDITRLDIDRSGMGRPDVGRHDLNRQDPGMLDLRRSDTGRPDLGRPDMRMPDMSRMDTDRPDIERRDLGRLDIKRPELDRSDMSRPDISRLDMGRPNMGRPDRSRLDMGGTDMGRPDMGRPDMGRPDMGRPDMGRPDMGRPDMGRLDMGRPDMGRPDMGRPDMGRPDMGRPDMGRPDMGRPDMGRPDMGRPDMGRPDMGRPDMGRPDLGRPEMGRSDRSRPDMGRSDMGRPDMGRPDMGRPDLGRPNMGRPDMGRLDVGRSDMGRPDMGRPDMGRPDMGRPDMGRLDMGRPDMGRPDMGRPDMRRPDMGRPDMGRPDMGRPDMGRPDMGRPDMGRPDMGRPDIGRPDMGRPDMGKPDMGRPSIGRPDMGRPNMGRPDMNRDYQRYPPGHSGPERHGLVDNESLPLTRTENQGLRNGPRQTLLDNSDLNNFGDQDRRGPPPRFPGERGPPSDKFHPGERVPLISNQRGVPDHDSGQMKPGFPQDQDTRVPPMFGKIPEGPGVNLSQPTERLPAQSGPPSDWDNRGSRDGPPKPPPLMGTPIPPSRMDTDFLLSTDITLPPEQKKRDESFPPLRSNQKPLLPDPIPRRDRNHDQDIRGNSFDRNMEFESKLPPRERSFDREFGNGHRGNIDMLDRHSPLPPGPFTPRGGMPGPPGDLTMVPYQGGPPGPPEYYTRIRNMPLSITYSGLRRFFGTLFIPRDGIKLINDNQGKRNGLGFVKLMSRREFDLFLSFNGQQMDDRRLVIAPCNFEEYHDAIDSFPMSRPLSPKRHMIDSDIGHSSPKRKRGQEQPMERPSRFVIMLRDVAQKATAQDLKKYFEHLDIAQNGRAIIADQDSSGRANGIVYVELTNPNDFNAALQRNYGRILGRVVYVSAADYKDIDRVKEKIEKRKKSEEKSKPSKDVGGGDSAVVTSNNRKPVKDSDDRQPAKTTNSKSSVNNASPKVETKSNQVSTKQNPVKPDTVKQTPTKQNPVDSPVIKKNPVKEDPGNSCVKISGLPAGVTKKDVEEFFKGLEISPKGYNPVLRKDGTCTGDAFVEFVNSNDCQKASAKNQQMMKDKKVSVVAVPRTNMESELEDLRKKALEEGQTNQINRPPPLYFMLGAQNLPFSVSIGEILNFFRGYNPVPESIRLHYSNEGRATGDAVIGFMTESECHRALRDLNSRMLGRRNIRLFLA